MANNTNMSGNLKINVKNTTVNIQSTELSGLTKAYIRVTITSNKMEMRTETLVANKGRALDFDSLKEFMLQSKDLKSTVKIDLVAADDSILGSAMDTIESIIAIPNISKTYELKGGVSGGTLTRVAMANVMYFWNPVLAEDKKKKKSVKSSKKEVTPIVVKSSATSLSANLTPEDFSRPSFMRVEYYYVTGKNIADYTKGMRVVSPIVMFGENSVNYVLEKFGIKGIESTGALDQSLTPFIHKFDSKVDDSISSVLEALEKGQTMLLQTKDATIEKVTKTSHATYDGIIKAKEKTMSTVGTAATSTYDGIVNAKEKTMSTVGTAATSTYDGIVNAKEKTMSTVGSATASTYKTVTGAAVYLISHVPILGKKVMA